MRPRPADHIWPSLQRDDITGGQKLFAGTLASIECAKANVKILGLARQVSIGGRAGRLPSQGEFHVQEVG